MRTLRFIPLAFVAGIHGFALFAPYAAVILAAEHVIRRRRRHAQVRLSTGRQVAEESRISTPALLAN